MDKERNVRDVIVVVNKVLGKNHRTLDAITDHELLATIAAMMIQICGAQIFMCNPHKTLRGEK